MLFRSNNEWSIPRYRGDVQRPIDVAEELIRIAGFEAVENPSKWQFSVPVHEAKSANKIRKSIAEKLASNGFREIMNNSLSKSAYADLSTSKQDGKAIELKNPLSRDLAILRTSMLWGMLETISYNRNRQASNLRLFEFGHTYHAVGNKMVEKPTLCLALTGIHEPESWMGTRNSSFFDLKGYLVNLIRSLNPTSIEECPLNPESAFSAGIEIKVNGKPLAQIGKVSNTWLKEFDLKQGVFAAQIDWKRWIELSKNSANSFQELPKSFTVRRDFALLIDHSTSFSTLAINAKKAASKQLIDVQLFDVYEGKNIAEGKKSYALAFYFRDPERTLTDEEIDADMNAIRNALESSCGATLR